ncbi:MAG TPA: anthranilate synthase component I family protein [Bacteroidales bacterium]|nr:anthranilate synthase component I family protein [Bacteroidales bacterium]
MNTQYEIKCEYREFPADTLTPVGVYLRLRDVYPGSLLLECTDFSSRTNAYSYVCINPIMGIEVDENNIKRYFPGGNEEKLPLHDVANNVDALIRSIRVATGGTGKGVHGFFGFTSFDSLFLFEKFDQSLEQKVSRQREIPFLKYDFFKIVLAFNHFNDTLLITEYYNADMPAGEIEKVLSILSNRNFTGYPFRLIGDEISSIGDSDFKKMVSEAIKHCAVGDVFQMVVSRHYKQQFQGDEFNVYRSLRSVNPSPYLFYFDYINYKIFGSSPEAQLKIQNGKAIINPIAGTIHRTGDAIADYNSAQELLRNPKENSEHVMLVDLARNDLSRSCTNVNVDVYKEVQAFSHLWHLVSTVSGDLNAEESPFRVFARTFPAGTLSGAPKHKAIELITGMEANPRGYYGGAIGYISLDGSLNHAILIRSFLSRESYLNYQAGAGIVINSTEQGELNEVGNKLDALRTALKKATTYTIF